MLTGWIFFASVGILQAQQLAGEQKEVDSTSLGFRLLHKGAVHIHVRSFFMATDNAAPLTDYAAWAVGAGLGYESPKIHGFQAGLTGFFIFNLYSTDLGVVDPLTKSASRYEIGLFDISNPSNKKDLDRLEDLYVKYSFSKTMLQLGRFELNTPFINRQDGRMRGTIEEGAWFETKELKHLKMEGGWLWKISPRSTIAWYNVEDSYGVYNSGLNELGSPSAYAGNITSDGIGLLGITYAPSADFKMQLWEQYAENVFNTSLIQTDVKWPLSKESNIQAGLMYIRQDALNDGGNINPLKSYIRKGSFSNVISARAGIIHRKLDIALNYTRISDNGRFLMPREWGREPFYTFMPRERNEGFADLQAYTIACSYPFMNGKLKTTLSYGQFFLPDVKDVARNKYGMPSYQQINADVKYYFDGSMKGLMIQLLSVYKGRMSDDYGNYKYVFNKVNMYNWSLMIDYMF